MVVVMAQVIEFRLQSCISVWEKIRVITFGNASDDAVMILILFCTPCIIVSSLPRCSHMSSVKRSECTSKSPSESQPTPQR